MPTLKTTALGSLEITQLTLKQAVSLILLFDNPYKIRNASVMHLTTFSPEVGARIE